MSIYAIYFSPTKGTEAVVTQIAQAFGDYTVIDLCDRKKDFQIAFSKDDICIIGVPSYGGRVPAAALDRINQFQGNQAKAVLTAVYGNRAFEDTLLELQDSLAERNFVCTAAVAAVAEHSIMHQFAAGRPDDADKAQLTEFVKQIQDKIASNMSDDAYLLKLPGNRPYREYNGVPLKPKAKSACTKCGLCEEQCPVGAIPKDAPDTTNSDLCISCMRCISICPKKARSVNRLMVEASVLKLKSSCQGRKENQLFL